MRNIFFSIFVFLLSCNSGVETANKTMDSSSVDSTATNRATSLMIDTMVKDSSNEVTNVPDDIKRTNKPSVQEGGNESEKVSKLGEDQKQKINIKVYKNTESSGYGYDIIMDGRLYIHQPNIPALPGNRGFASKDDAQNVAELVVHKIRKNIMPPTVEVKELEELGIK